MQPQRQWEDVVVEPAPVVELPRGVLLDPSEERRERLEIGIRIGHEPLVRGRQQQLRHGPALDVRQRLGGVDALRLLEALMASGSDLVLIPVQDAFGWRDRINEPASVSEENWTYKLPWLVDRLEEIPEARERRERLRAWTARYERI